MERPAPTAPPDSVAGAVRARIATVVERPSAPARELAALPKRLVEVRDIKPLDLLEQPAGGLRRGSSRPSSSAPRFLSPTEG
jgi:hypothetical protein